MAMSFPGGIRPDEAKYSASSPIDTMQAGSLISIPISHPEGGDLTPCVKVGDPVLVGQILAEGEGICCPVHSGVSGTVRRIGPMLTPYGERMGIEIENDFRLAPSPSIQPFSRPLHSATPEEITDHIRQKGITGHGGAGYPAWAKIASCRGKAARLVINCCESEPYLTSNHRLLLERTNQIVGGTKILLRALECEKAMFVMEDNKEDAAEALVRLVGNSKSFSLAVLKTKYPQGDERLLCRALKGKEIPKGAGTVDMGLVVFNVQTAYAVYRAFVEGMPQVSKVITVSGDCVKNPTNLSVPLGVSLQEIFDRCGGFSSPPNAVICGGPMMGKAQETSEIPLTAEVEGLLALSVKKTKESPCIRCGRCLRACPMHLSPMSLYRAARKEKKEKLVRYHAEVCTQCGSCTWVCPAHIPLAEIIASGKALIRQDQAE